MTKFFGSMRDIWEGENESYIQNIKRELIGVRHTVQFLCTLLNKLLQTSVLARMNAGIPFDDKTQYTRTYIVKIYKGTEYQNPQNILLRNNVVSGVIERTGKMFLCL